MNLHNLVASWLVFTGLVLVSTVTFGYRILQDRDRVGWSMIFKLLISNMLMLIMAISSLPSPVPLWLYLIRVFCVQFGTLFIYIAVAQFFNNRPYQPMLRNRHFIVISVLSLIGLGLVYLREQGLAPAHNHQVVRPWAHYSSYMLNYSIYLYLLARIILLYWRSLRRYRDLPYLVRLWVCMCGFIAAAFTMVVQGVHDILGPSLRFLSDHLLHRGFEAGMLSTVVLLTVGFLVPQALITRIVQPFQRMRIWRQQQHHASVQYLHHAMTRIVPGVQLHNQRLRDIRMLVEISDARQIIWSLQPHTLPITPEAEAAYLARLLVDNTIIDCPGEHQPPHTKQPDIVKHNLAVARILKRQLVDVRIPSRSDRAA